ncbi:leukocyte elastase inhibitor-like [Varanus komodoensis]|uniref:leukocyte elastase inhibitor-like n=1 Tax=Varanus komodoensis TaxID=61221 RepID=UPI001CF7AC3E|nr:leukocyte elastase inhibitor-like [Varanus komodoensis]
MDSIWCSQEYSSNTVLFQGIRSPDVRLGLRLEAAPHGSSTNSRKRLDPPCCPHHEVPDYECETPEGVHTAFHKILVELYKPSAGHVLSIANRLYGDQDIAFLQKFLYCALKLYWTKVDRVKIHNAPEEVRQLINLWAEVHTQGKIKDLLPKGSIDCLTQLLQVNALYFKGQWEVKFNKEFTQEGPFFLNEKDCTAVQLMYRKGQYRTGKIEGCDVQVLEIPYRNHDLSLFILLPRNCKPESLRELEDELDDLLLDWSCILKLKEVEVLIPKFSIEKCLDANAYLDMSALTDPQKANFSRATTTTGVALSQLVHHTVIEIDEEGGEEPEAPTCHHDTYPCQEPKPFVANHPFVYYVLHKATQSLVALGKFIKPEERVDVH